MVTSHPQRVPAIRWRVPAQACGYLPAGASVRDHGKIWEIPGYPLAETACICILASPSQIRTLFLLTKLADFFSKSSTTPPRTILPTTPNTNTMTRQQSPPPEEKEEPNDVPPIEFLHRIPAQIAPVPAEAVRMRVRYGTPTVLGGRQLGEGNVSCVKVLPWRGRHNTASSRCLLV
ncbi:hypothetical protein PSTT_02793 [Puccinia striiformis]|uniref:Uncharacterized protein n=1 Tax=Puccinia striiformis TaxID=27350 RepID=A0A2S4VYU3_9BASI|nr:hypothetical protein PSTT_02793 [Puccinia striiformis]